MEASESEDSTAVLTMKRDFDAFFTHGSSRKDDSKKPKLSFDHSSFLDRTPSQTHSVSMQKIVEKERQEKLRQAELIKAKSYITQLESQILTSKRSYQQSKIEQEKALEDLKMQQQWELDKCVSAKQQLHMLMNKEEETGEELKELRKEHGLAKTNYEQKIMGLQRQKLKLENELQELQHTSHNKIFELKNEKMRHDLELQICQSELEETKLQLQNSLKRFGDLKQQMEEYEEFRLKSLHAEQKIKDLESTLSGMEEDVVINKAMRSQLTRMPEIERNNRKLREENQYCKNTQENTLLLKEEILGLKEKLERSENRCTDNIQMQLKFEEMENTLQQWQNIDGSGRQQSPYKVSHHISELQMNNSMMLEKQGQLEISKRSMEQSMRAAQEKMLGAEEQLIREKQKNKECVTLIKRLQRVMPLITKERDSYKEILDVYEKDPNMDVTAASSSRVKELENIVNAYYKQVAMLQAEVEAVQNQLSETTVRSQMLEVQLQHVQQSGIQVATSEVDQKIILELRNQIADLHKRVEHAEEQKEILEARIEQRHLQGDFDPTKTKVVHLKMNPASLAQKQRAEELSRLREEKERLKQRVQLLQESGSKAQDITLRVEEQLQQPSTSQEVQDIKAQLMSAGLKNKRLMEAFKKTSHEFREVCYQLLGFRIDIPQPSQYRLMNMYAESPNDYLMFQQSSNGDLQLLETDYSRTLTEMVETYLYGTNSIPAFLSSVTMDLFSRQTMLS